MPLPTRSLTVKLTFPSSGEASEALIIDDSNQMDMSVKTSKNVIVIQNTCIINIAGLRQDVRQRLLTAFTAWNYRKTPTANYVQVEIFAAYEVPGAATEPSRIFIGDVTKCDISDQIPNSAVLIEAFTRQVDRTNLVSVTVPKNASFKTLVETVGKAAGLYVDCETSYDKSMIRNFGVFQINPTGAPYRLNIQASIVGLSALFPDSVAIWVDDDTLIARDIGRVVGTVIPKVKLFIDAPPSWTEWGVTFKTLFNQNLRLGGGVELESAMNPGVNGQYVITGLEYDLASRQNPFYVTVKASPPGQSAEAQ